MDISYATDDRALYRDYKGLWVALDSADQVTVLASAKTLAAVLAKLKAQGYRKAPTVTRVPEWDGIRIGGL